MTETLGRKRTIVSISVMILYQSSKTKIQHGRVEIIGCQEFRHMAQ